jgi:hypothetical protein
MLSFNGARVDQVLEKVLPSVVMMSSLTPVPFCELTFSAMQASPGHTTTFLFDKCFITP